MSYSSEVLTDSPLAYWRLNETSGTSAADSSGNSRTATYTNSPTLGVTGLLVGDSDKAMSIATASGQCTTIASASWMNVSAITVEALVNFTASVDNGSGDCVVSRLTSNLDWVLVRDFAGTLTASVWNNSGTRYNATSGVLSNNTVYHVAFTFDGSNLKLYVNGSVVATTACTGTVAALADPIEIGRYSASTSTSPAAVIDEVAIYGSGLSGARIAAHYTAATVASASSSGSLTLGGSAGAAAPAVAAGSLSLGGGSSIGQPASGAGSLTLGGTSTGVGGASAMGSLTLGGSSAGSGRAAAAGSITFGSTAEAHPLYTTDLSNVFTGWSLSWTATVSYTQAVSPTPAGSTRGTRVDKATPLPLPTLVNGRPT